MLIKVKKKPLENLKKEYLKPLIKNFESEMFKELFIKTSITQKNKKYNDLFKILERFLNKLKAEQLFLDNKIFIYVFSNWEMMLRLLYKKIKKLKNKLLNLIPENFSRNLYSLIINKDSELNYYNKNYINFLFVIDVPELRLNSPKIIKFLKMINKKIFNELNIKIINPINWQRIYYKSQSIKNKKLNLDLYFTREFDVKFDSHLTLLKIMSVFGFTQSILFFFRLIHKRKKF